MNDSVDPMIAQLPISPTDFQLFLDDMWQDYIQLNAEAFKIHRLFTRINHGPIINDHIALRTFNLSPVCLDVMECFFIAANYVERGQYTFQQKKLRAKHFEHANPMLPKIFISELLVEQLSSRAQKIIRNLVSQVKIDQTHTIHFCCSGRSWNVSLADYQYLLKESEYAAWMSAFGYRPNHFTVSVNHLKTLTSLQEVNQLLLSNHFRLNEAGGLIKGTPDVYLEQSSTLANEIDVSFDDGHIQQIPSCYYEFARRYPMPNGQLYQGFITNSADKIFESTHVHIH